MQHFGGQMSKVLAFKIPHGPRSVISIIHLDHYYCFALS